MADWFSANAGSIIPAASALVGVLVTALFNFFSNLSNSKNLREARESQNNFEKWKTNREFYVNKAEEIFDLIDKWGKSANTLHQIQMLRIEGLNSDEDVGKAWRNYNEVIQNQRINMFLSLYYKDFTSGLNEISELSEKINHDYVLTVSSQKDSDKKAFLREASARNEEINKKISHFKTQLAQLTQVHL
ncbi:hypothetical protein ACV0NV_005187 [Klebsiella pneumoniae]|uniref:hypothetical protein n=2 Tax=Klebsiella pneumoniae TaxID=573 RepID=UPI0003BF5CBB|nr:hypothetical protein [Klebsiella pneumoniae]HDS5027780.1 hypothetical protein [Klebsiella pneumoniae subsp. ozaenae]ELA2290761.1 hypothetical protein [Klebsiella pneumoniae]ELA2365065.1 hypothetical protein [Klebsiella pneumoniae]ELA2391648.1 hypothetical protein [Klebsiella pneumoniae]ELC3569362.1 hypothetical protein [Klebsiella pneumoniae]